MEAQPIVPKEYTLEENEEIIDAINNLMNEIGEAIYCAKVGVTLYYIPLSKKDEFLKQEENKKK